MYKLSLIDKISIAFIFFGGINYGLIGLFNLNIPNILFGKIFFIEKIFYILIGISTINSILFIKKSTN